MGRLGSCLVVLLWGVAWVVRAPPALEPEPARVAIQPARARVAAPEPAPEPPPPPAPEGKAAPEPSEPAAAATTEVVVGSEDVARGEDLLRGGGAFPPLHASYDGLGSFSVYARAMRSLGARFVAVDDRKVAAEIDVAGELLGSGMPSGRFSPRARDYSDEPALSGARRRVRERFGSGATVMMLVPRRLDAALFGSVSRWLRERGESPGDYRGLEARYAKGPDGALRLHVDAGTRLDGSRRPLGLVFDLSAASGRGA